MDANLKSKVERLLLGETLIFSDGELDDLLGYRITNYIRSKANPGRIGIKDTWICWIGEKLEKARNDNPFSKS